MKAVVEAVRLQPVINSLYDDEAEVIKQYGGVHIGIATQTENGLMVPVVRHCEVRSLWDNANEVKRLSAGCRDGCAERDELSGSTITISSLGPLGAIATTPIINHPEVGHQTTLGRTTVCTEKNDEYFLLFRSPGCGWMGCSGNGAKTQSIA